VTHFAGLKLQSTNIGTHQECQEEFTMNNKVSNETINAALHWRYATKKFDAAKKISGADWETLEETLRLSPSSYGLQPWKFVVVQNMDLRKKLTPVSWNQPQIETCSHLVVVTRMKNMNEAYVDRFIKSTADQRGIQTSELKGYRDMMVSNVVGAMGQDPALMSAWTARQAYIAAGFFMNNAALLGVDVCPMEGIDGSKYDEILSLSNTEYGSVLVLAAGYRAADDGLQHAKKSRFSKAEIIQTLK